MSGASLGNAELSGSDFSGADLTGANLSSSKDGDGVVDAIYSKYPPADLTGTVFRDANLTNAVFTNATGLQTHRFGGADLTGAKLPEHIATFEALAHVEELSKHARTIFLAVIGACVFSWLTIATTTDTALLTSRASTPLPVIGTKIPIGGFFLFAPLILLSMYIYLHLYLQRLWESMSALPAVFPDGRTLDEKAYPWMLSGMIRWHVPRLRADLENDNLKVPALAGLQLGLSVILAWGLTPFTLGWFWLRYLPLHEWLGTGFHIAVHCASIMVGITFYWLARRTLRGVAPPRFTAPVIINTSWGRVGVGISISIVLVSWVFFDGAINAPRLESSEADSARPHRQFVPRASGENFESGIPFWLEP